MNFPAPAIVTARYMGDPGGSTTRYYWVQALYPSGNSTLAASQSIANTPAALSINNRVLVSWTPVPGATGYKVYGATSSTLPSSGATILAMTATSETAFTDKGDAYTSDTVKYPQLNIARARYSFATDGGLVSNIIPADSDTIPKNAIVLGGIANPTTALTSGGSATISIGTSAGSGTASILALTAVASYSIDALIELMGQNSQAAAQKVPFKMSAAGQLQISVAVAALTAGILEILVWYVVATSA